MRLLRLVLLAFLAVGFCPRELYCGEYDAAHLKEAFNKGCSSYEKSLFKDAIKEYEAMIAKGVKSGNIYYNLGNAYFKTGSLGKAVLNYERAKRLMPYDADLKTNLEYARSLVRETEMDKATLRIRRYMDSFFDNLSINGLTISLSFIYLVIIAFLMLWVFVKSMRRFALYAAGFLLVLFLITFTLLSINIYRIERLQKGIIIKEVKARFEPLQDAVAHFPLYEGCCIYMIKTRGDWSQIKREDGRIGWIELSSYELI